jgi:hypothetical protein
MRKAWQLLAYLVERMQCFGLVEKRGGLGRTRGRWENVTVRNFKPAPRERDREREKKTARVSQSTIVPKTEELSYEARRSVNRLTTISFSRNRGDHPRRLWGPVQTCPVVTSLPSCETVQCRTCCVGGAARRRPSSTETPLLVNGAAAQTTNV